MKLSSHWLADEVEVYLVNKQKIIVNDTLK